MGHRVDDARDDVAVLAEAVGGEDGHGHDLDTRVRDPGDAAAVVGARGDDAGHGRAVAVRVGRSGGAIEHRRAGHELAGKIRVRGVDTGVEQGDDRAA